MKRFVLIAMLMAPPAFAGPLPALFDVTGVEPGDVLNIRAEPSAGASALGELAADARGVEVVSERDGWAQVNNGESAGWVNARYLRPAGEVWSGGLPPTLSCAGTEPFWSLKQAGGGLVLSTPDGPDQTFAQRQVLDGFGAQRSVLADGLTVVVTPAACSDGMSDRAFGLAATVILGAAPEARQLSGCCTLAQ